LPGTPVVFELDAAALTVQPLPSFQPIPRQQSAWRDIAVIAGEQVGHDALIETAKAANADLVRTVKLFDVYKPVPGASTDMAAGERSLALRLEILDDSTTLTDERIESVKAEVVAALAQRLGVRLRA
jgi:phenylalanyl-tRNA synthetase beta chain